MQTIECIFAQKKFRGEFRYSARTRVIIDEKSVRIVQRMKKLAARKPASSFWLLADPKPNSTNSKKIDEIPRLVITY